MAHAPNPPVTGPPVEASHRVRERTVSASKAPAPLASAARMLFVLMLLPVIPMLIVHQVAYVVLTPVVGRASASLSVMGVWRASAE